MSSSFYKKKILLLGASLLACFLLFEVLVRLLPVGRAYDYRKQFYLYTKTHPRWGTSFPAQANTRWDYTGRESVPINITFKTIPVPGFPDYGIRDDGIDTSAHRKILVLGDSYTYGATVELEETWCERIENKNPGVDMINAAFMSGCAKAAVFYEDVRDKIEHDMIVYGLWLGNEFLDNYVVWQLKEQNIITESEDNLWDYYEQRRILRRIYDISKLSWIFTEAFRQFLGLGPKAKTFLIDYLPEPDGIWVESVGNIWLHPRNWALLNYCRDYSGIQEIEKGILQTKTSLRQIQRLAEESGKPFAVILFPFKEQIYLHLFKQHLHEEIDIQKPDSILVDFCSKNGIVCFDLYPALLAYRHEKLFWDYDAHFNRKGQYYASKEIEKFLKETGYIQE